MRILKESIVPQFGKKKDFEKARKYADSEYEKRIKKLTGKQPTMYTINSFSKALSLLSKVYSRHRIPTDKKTIKMLIDKLNDNGMITPDVYREVLSKTNIVLQKIKSIK